MNHHKPGSLTQLIARLSDGTITPDEITQLNQQLLADPIAMEAYLDHMELDAMLEREFGGQASVKMPHGIPMAGCLGLSPSRGKASWQLLTRVALTAVVLLVVGYVVHSFLSRGPERPHLVQDAPSEVADNSRRPMAFGRVLDDGEALTIEAGTEVLHFQDGTKITLTGPATLVVHHPAIGKRLQLRQGMLQAEVTPQPADQPLVIDTPNAAVRVLGTRFELSADEQSGTCLNLESGRVELLREGQASVFVAPNSIAMVPTTDEPIMIMPRPRMLVAPKRETRCSGQGLWSLEFAEVGRTVVAASNLGAFYWHEDDVTETILALPDLKRNEVRLLGSSGPLVAFEQKSPPRIVLWNAVKRTPLRIMDDLDKWPSAVQRNASDPKRLTLMREFGVFSPRGDWAVSYARIGDGDELRIHDLAGRQSNVLLRPKTFMMCFQPSPDGSLLAVGEYRHSPDEQIAAAIELIAPATGKQVSLLPALEKREKIRPGIVPIGLAFSTNGRIIVAALNHELQVWDVTNAKRIARIQNVGVDERVLSVSNDGQTIAAAAAGARRVQLWDVAHPGDSTAIDVDEPIRALKFSPDGRALAAIVGHNRLMMLQVNRSLPERD